MLALPIPSKQYRKMQFYYIHSNFATKNLVSTVKFNSNNETIGNLLELLGAKHHKQITQYFVGIIDYTKFE